MKVTITKTKPKVTLGDIIKLAAIIAGIIGFVTKTWPLLIIAIVIFLCCSSVTVEVKKRRLKK